MSAASVKPRVLVVDDSATVRHWMEAQLREWYDVSSARDGEEAITVALAERPDLILLDVEMPRVDGFAACRALRAFAGMRRTPIVMVTSRTEPADVETGFTSGCTDFIGKPVDVTELHEKVASWIAASAAPDDVAS
jgi:CheY-like chemotaxis protein